MTTAAPGGSGLAGQAWRVSVSSELQLFWVQREASSRPHGLVRLLLVSTRERWEGPADDRHPAPQTAAPGLSGRGRAAVGRGPAAGRRHHYGLRRLDAIRVPPLALSSPWSTTSLPEAS